MSERNLRHKIEWASENGVASLTFPIEELEVYARLEGENERLRGHLISARKYLIHVEGPDATAALSHVNLALASEEDIED